MLLYTMNTDLGCRSALIELVPFTSWVFVKPPAEPSAHSCHGRLPQNAPDKRLQGNQSTPGETDNMAEDGCPVIGDEVFTAINRKESNTNNLEGTRLSLAASAGTSQNSKTTCCPAIHVDLAEPISNQTRQSGANSEQLQVRRQGVVIEMEDHYDADDSDEGSEEMDSKYRRMSEPARPTACLGSPPADDIPNTAHLNKRASSVDFLPGRRKPRILSMRAKLLTGGGSHQSNRNTELNNNVPRLPHDTTSPAGTALSGDGPDHITGNNNSYNGYQARQHLLGLKPRDNSYCTECVGYSTPQECQLATRPDETCKNHDKEGEINKGFITDDERIRISIKPDQNIETNSENRPGGEYNPAKQYTDSRSDLLSNPSGHPTSVSDQARRIKPAIKSTKCIVTSQLTVGSTWTGNEDGQTDHDRETLRRVESDPNMKGVRQRIPLVILEEDEETADVAANYTSIFPHRNSLINVSGVKSRNKRADDTSRKSSHRNRSKVPDALTNSLFCKTSECKDNSGGTGSSPVVPVVIFEDAGEDTGNEESNDEGTSGLPASDDSMLSPTWSCGGLAIPTGEERERLQKIADSAIQGLSSRRAGSNTSLVSDDDDMDELKTLAARLNLPTRRPSYCIWKDKYINKSLLGSRETRGSQASCESRESEQSQESRGKEDSDECVQVEDDDWSLERKMRIDSALEWLQKELRAMRAQDHDLARQLMQIRKTIQEVKLQRCTEENRENLAEAIDIEEERNDFAELFDFVPDQINPSLQHIGLTRMNINRRRFSVF